MQQNSEQQAQMKFGLLFVNVIQKFQTHHLPLPSPITPLHTHTHTHPLP